jgi:hypothetical protein
MAITFTFTCQCGRELAAPATAAGRRARCPQCQATVRVPAAPVARPEPTDPDTWQVLMTWAKHRGT